ncbi:MAG: histidine phosphatase family protein [Prolixibacteraceae bacterium]|nr:histidine phosphatase family protein [Prolixibacteraceae bacterium]
MKRLVIIRHAKTEQQGYENDYARELLPRGVDDAHQIAASLREKGIVPNKMISSPATRAITTAQIFAEELGYPALKIKELRELYFNFTTQDFVELIRSTRNDVETLFIVGHNPFMHFVAQNLSTNYDGHMPTCSTVVLDFDIDKWKAVEARQGTLFMHLYPKQNRR